MKRIRLGTRVAIVAVVVSSASACTLFSGWSDLQGGAASRDGGGRDDDTDSATSDGAIPGRDARADTSTVPGTGVQCGASPCAATEGCCHVPGGVDICSDTQTCAAADGLFLRCDSRDSCSTTGLDCCLGGNDPPRADCSTACSAQGKVVLCDPTEARPCLTGACTGQLGTARLMFCR